MSGRSAARRHDRVLRHGDVDWERSSDSAESVSDSDPESSPTASEAQNFSDCADSVGIGHGDGDVESDDNDAVAAQMREAEAMANEDKRIKKYIAAAKQAKIKAYRLHLKRRRVQIWSLQEKFSRMAFIAKWFSR